MRSTANKGLRAFLVWVAVAAGGCTGTQESPTLDRPPAPPAVSWSEDADLRLSLEPYPLVYDDPDQFLLDVFFENRGDHPLIVLPSLLRRQYRPMDDSGEVTYRPATAPEVSPWEGAFTVSPGETKAITLMGMEDGAGAWELGRGFYRMSVRYFVTEALTANGTGPELSEEESEAMVWIGDQESEELTVRYEPPGSAEPAAGVEDEPQVRQGRADQLPFEADSQTKPTADFQD